MNIEEIKTIVKLMADYDLTEFQVESESATLSIKRGTNGVAMPAIAIPAAAPVAAPVPAAAPAPAAAAESNAPKITIDSPIVGTFYRAPAPDRSLAERDSETRPRCLLPQKSLLSAP